MAVGSWVGSGPQGPRQASGPQMRVNRWFPLEGSSQSPRKSLFLYMSDLFHIRSDILTHLQEM